MDSVWTYLPVESVPVIRTLFAPLIADALAFRVRVAVDAPPLKV